MQGSDYSSSGVKSGRVRALEKKREAERLEFEKQKQEIERAAQAGTAGIDSKFAKQTVTVAEKKLKAQSYGLITNADYKATQDGTAQPKEPEKKVKKKKKAKALINKATLSFGADEELEGEPLDEPPTKKKKVLKNPDVETSFLPDRERDEFVQAERRKLEQEWKEMQEKIKNEVLEITYSYWDGSGHRRTTQVTKGTTIRGFLDVVRQEFSHELRGISCDDLMYVKEDLIIPHTYTFYDLIINKARGKSGPLFNFDVHDDVRMYADATVEKDESHAGKVVERRWFERNKHIFPASRWETYDPNREYDSYTIKGGEVR